MPEDQQPRLKLYHAIPSRGSTAMWMLEEVGQPYATEVLRLREGDQRKPEFLALNPMGKVPTLVDGETVVSEVAAICCYLADAYPQAGLAPAVHDPRRGPYLKWLFFVPSCVEPAMIDKVADRPPAPRATAGWGDFDTVLSVVQEATARASPYLLGSDFSAADVVMGSTLRWGLKFKVLPELPELVRYVERLKERPALQRQLAWDEAFDKQVS